MTTTTPPTPSGARQHKPRGALKGQHLFVRTSTETHRRWRVLAAERDLSYEQLLIWLLDDHDRRREVAARLQSSPLHRVEGADDDTDDDTHRLGRML